ncbi:MAG: phosphoribosylaminoimidazolesuccinocarboxamide synthase [Bdellovibrionales bacterium]|nr:phosphoribosylaminoimidazolesuccinocarboxamide synthase [Bdellovibrionales bacterium]
MKEEKLLYEGKGKKIFQISHSKDQVLLFFKDDLTAYQAKKKGAFENKGEICRKISSLIFKYLEKNGIETHWIEDVSSRQMRCFKTEMIPLEVVIRNRLAGSTAKRLGLKEGQRIEEALLEFYYKRDDLDDPFVSEEQIKQLGLIKNKSLIKDIKEKSFLINKHLQVFFKRANLELVDFKMEFGLFKNKILLADEMSPDSCRIWEEKTGERLDKDRFRRNWGQVKESYQKIECLLFKTWKELSDFKK